MTTPPPEQVSMNYFPQAQKTFQPPLIANENAFLGDITSSEKQDAVSPMSCGLYRLEKGTPLVYEYTVSNHLFDSFTLSLLPSFLQIQCGWERDLLRCLDQFFIPGLYTLAERNDVGNSMCYLRSAAPRTITRIVHMYDGI